MSLLPIRTARYGAREGNTSQETERVAPWRGPSEGHPPPGKVNGHGAARGAPASTLEAARRVGPDIQVAMAALHPDSSGDVLFLPPAGLNEPCAPVRLRADRSILPRLLERRTPIVSNDLAHPRFDEELDLLRRGLCAYVAVPLDAPGWSPGAALFASQTVRRFDALTVASLLGHLEETLHGRGESAAGESARASGPPETLIGESPEFLDICRLIALVARRDTTVLIQGESGTGKEIVARTIHQYSRRSGGPFIRVNCAALTETLIESEMFGHRKGAFTGAIAEHKGRFEAAHGGTLLLDEIGNMSLSGQAKLLRVLQEQEFEPVGQSRSVRVDVRVVATTNVLLAQAVADGAFRQDLFYRLAVVPVTLLPIRARRGDIIPLAEYFLARDLAGQGRPPMRLSEATRRVLHDHEWPGNARELKNAIEYAVLVARGSEIHPEHLPASIRAGRGGGESSTLRSTLLRFEKQAVLDALQRAQGVRKETARLLGINPRNMSYLLRKHGIR